MTARPEFRLLPLAELLPHEEIQRPAVRRLIAHIRRVGAVDDPIWVAEGSMVILNGHHRVAALRALGAEFAPAWVMPYDPEVIRLERWQDGPPIERAEVVRRATAHQLYPPKTTRHILTIDLPHRPTPLTELFPPGTVPGPGARQRRASGRSPSPAARARDSG